MSTHEREPQQPEREASESLEDLDLPQGVDVSGGALNAYISAVTGEKQGKTKGG